VREVDGAEALAHAVLRLALRVGAAHLALAAVDGARRAGAAALTRGVPGATRFTPVSKIIFTYVQNMRLPSFFGNKFKL
jgi:hypothetical protein